MYNSDVRVVPVTHRQVEEEIENNLVYGGKVYDITEDKKLGERLADPSKAETWEDYVEWKTIRSYGVRFVRYAEANAFVYFYFSKHGLMNKLSQKEIKDLL